MRAADERLDGPASPSRAPQPRPVPRASPRLPGAPGTLPSDHPLSPRLYRAGVELARDLLLAVRGRPLRSRLARPRLAERLDVLLSQRLPAGAYERLSRAARAGARLLGSRQDRDAP